MSFIFQKKPLFFLFFLAFILVPSGLVFGQSATGTRIGFFNPLTISPGTLVEVPIEIKDVEGLYALDITFQFNPAVIAAHDGDSGTSGIQMALGQFLDPGLMLFNTIDNANGTGHFVMTQVNPSEAKSGDGILLVIYFEGLNTGESTLHLTDVQLSTRDGNPITAAVVDSLVKVEANAPPMVSTSIPVHQSTQMIQIPTLESTITPTATTLSTAQVSSGDDAQPPQQSDGEHQDENGGTLGTFISGNWWIVLVLLLLVLAAGIFLLVIRRKA